MEELEQKLIAVLNEYPTMPFDMKAYVVRHLSEVLELNLQIEVLKQKLQVQQENSAEENVDE